MPDCATTAHFVRRFAELYHFPRRYADLLSHYPAGPGMIRAH